MTDTRIKTTDELKQLVIRNDGRRVIHVGDVARISLDEQQEFIRINANGHDAVVLDLIKQKDVNLVDFAVQVIDRAEEIRKELPKGMVLKPYYDQAVFVTNSIDSVMRAIYEGLFLAILVVIVFLRSFRASMNIILIIPVTLALTIIVLHLAGITLNIMSLGAIAASIGLIIDDAIVIIEQIHRTHEEHPEKDKYTVAGETVKHLFPGDAWFFFEHHCDLPSIHHDERCCGQLFQGTDTDHGNHSRLQFSRYLDRNPGTAPVVRLQIPGNEDRRSYRRGNPGRKQPGMADVVL